MNATGKGFIEMLLLNHSSFVKVNKIQRIICFVFSKPSWNLDFQTTQNDGTIVKQKPLLHTYVHATPDEIHNGQRV